MSEGKPSVITVTMAATVDGKRVAVTRTYRETMINEATADRIVDELFASFEADVCFTPSEPSSDPKEKR
jgi:hypothetical protein